MRIKERSLLLLLLLLSWLVLNGASLQRSGQFPWNVITGEYLTRFYVL